MVLVEGVGYEEEVGLGASFVGVEGLVEIIDFDTELQKYEVAHYDFYN